MVSAAIVLVMVRVVWFIGVYCLWVCELVKQVSRGWKEYRRRLSTTVADRWTYKEGQMCWTMDPKIVQEILDLKLCNRCPWCAIEESTITTFKDLYYIYSTSEHPATELERVTLEYIIQSSIRCLFLAIRLPSLPFQSFCWTLLSGENPQSRDKPLLLAWHIEDDIYKRVSWYLQNNEVEHTYRFNSAAQRRGMCSFANVEIKSLSVDEHWTNALQLFRAILCW